MKNDLGRDSQVRKAMSLALIIVVVIWALFPFYWAIITSFKMPKDTFTISYIPFLQFKPTLNNWVRELVRGREVAHAIKNSLVVAVVSSTLALFLGTSAAYALARFRFQKWKNQDIAIWFLSLRVLPPVVVVIPFFLIMKSLGLLDTKLGLILVNTTFVLPFAVLIMRSMFIELPVELEEAALVDGCSRFGVFFKILLPLTTSGLAATFLICWAFTWNEFLFALTLTYKQAVTVPVVISGGVHSRGIEFWFIATRSMVAIIPPVIVALVLQRFLVRGLTFGAIKG